MKNLSLVSAVLFDMDGVIIDSERAALVVWKDICTNFGLDLTEEIALSLIGVGLKGTTEILKKHFGEKFNIEKAIIIREQCWDKYLKENQIPVKKGFFDLLMFLEKYSLPYGIVSSTERVMLEKRLEISGINKKRFSVIICGDDVENKKPHPEPYLLAAQKINILAESCLVIEDSAHGANAGIAAGMRVVVVPDLIEPTKSISDSSWAILRNLEEVKEFLLSEVTSSHCF